MHGLWPKVHIWVGLKVRWKDTQQQCVGVWSDSHWWTGKTCFVFVLYSHIDFLCFHLWIRLHRTAMNCAAEDFHTEKQGWCFNIPAHPGENFCHKITKVKHKAYLITAGGWRMVSILPFLFLLLLALIMIFAVWLLPVLALWLLPVLTVWLLPVLAVWLLLVLAVWLLPILAIWLFATFTIILITLKQQHTTEELLIWLGSREMTARCHERTH